MSKFTKEDVQFHEDRPWGELYPAINVKCYNYIHSRKVQEKFKCSEKTADKALEFAFESAQERFWEDAQEEAKEIIWEGVKIYSAGRSGGWLIAQKLGDVKDWDAIALSKWRKFVKYVENEIKYLCSEEYVLEEIEANKWYLEGAEQYNFFEGKDGKTRCMAEMKQEAIKAGFGPIVRSGT